MVRSLVFGVKHAVCLEQPHRRRALELSLWRMVDSRQIIKNTVSERYDLLLCMHLVFKYNFIALHTMRSRKLFTICRRIYMVCPTEIKCSVYFGNVRPFIVAENFNKNRKTPFRRLPCRCLWPQYCTSCALNWPRIDHSCRYDTTKQSHRRCSMFWAAIE